MIRWIVQPMLARFGSATEHTRPTRYEVALGHVVYGLGALMVLSALARSRGILPAVGLGDLLGAAGAAAALGLLFVYWAVFHRRVPPEPWFFSHLLWVSLTYAFVFLWVAVSAVALTVGVLFALVLPPLALLLVYGPMLAGGLIAVWMTWRLVRGYVAYLRRRPVGLPAVRWRSVST